MFRKDPYLFAAVLGLVGGCLTYWAELNKGRIFKFSEFACAACTSCLLGYIVCLGAHGYLSLSFEACGALAGFAGLMGEQATDILLDYLKSKGYWPK